MFKSTATERRRAAQSGKPYKPHNYQKKAIKWLLERAAAALFLDPGLGKTSIVLAAFKVLLGQGLAKGLLVVAPLRPAQSTWPKEREKWLDFQSLDMVVLHGRDKDKLAAEKHDVYVVNYEGLDWLIKSGALARMLKLGLVDILCWDELSKMKNSASKRFKAIRPWLPKFARRWGLTGSPASNGLLGLFGEMYVLDCGKTFGHYVTHYRSRYFVPKGMYDWVPAKGAKELIYERLKPTALRMDARDYLELPAVLPIPCYYELPPDAVKHYKSLEDDFLTWLGDKPITAVNNGVLSGKLRQICSGAMYTTDSFELTGAPKPKGQRDFIVLHDAKLDAFEDLVEELNGQQLLVAYEFNHDLERIIERFGDVPYIGGGVSTKKARQYEDAWNAGELPWLFAHPASMGHGMNLQEGDAYNMCFFTLTWDFELYDQFMRRLLRQGNKSKHLNLYQLIGRGTVEEKNVLPTLEAKKREQDELHAGVKNRRAKKVAFDGDANMASNRLLEAKMREQRKKTRAA